MDRFGPTNDERVGNQADIYVESIDGDINFQSGETFYSYAQLGHGGRYTDGDQIGNITVIADADASAALKGHINFLVDQTLTTDNRYV